MKYWIVKICGDCTNCHDHETSRKHHCEITYKDVVPSQAPPGWCPLPDEDEHES